MDTAIVVKNSGLSAAFDAAVSSWADSTTDPTTPRRGDLLRDKTRMVTGFFAWCGKPVDQVRAQDVKGWQRTLESQYLSQSTVYGSIIRLSSFYDWAMKDPGARTRITSNPVNLARPKAPTAYQNESCKALTDDQVKRLVAVVKGRTDVQGLRDYALLMFYLLVGLRREEVASLRWANIELREQGLVIRDSRTKGGEIVSRQVNSNVVKDALLEYLKADGRLDQMTPDSPLWLRHDRAVADESSDGVHPHGLRSQLPVSAHGLAKTFKAYAKQAGISGFHVHMLRHSFARICAEESGSMAAVSEALGHKSQSATASYVRRITTRRDNFSSLIAERFANG